MKTAYSYIRFSSSKQELGDSLRRQIEKSERYAQENNLKLDDTLNMKDLGLSAFKGVNRKKGALGEFLELVKKGRIAKGSILILESIDRLSREEPADAIPLFFDIINSEIELVTLDTNQSYTRESFKKNPSQLYVYVGELQRAYRESENKSMRLKSAWVMKRKEAMNGKHQLTARVPQWIKVKDGKFELIPEVVYTIELIFRKKLAGIGNEKIARDLNSLPNVWKPSKGILNKTGGWQKSSVTKLLSNRELLGEYQLYRLQDGKRTKIEGEIIPNYFPVAIDESLFYEVQNLIENNANLKGHAGGKTGKASNVFAHVAICGLCGGAMHFIDKGHGSKGGQYLHCDNSRRNKAEQCTAKPIRYNEFEKLFFDNFEELDIDKLIGNETELDARLIELNMIVSKHSEQMATIESKISNLQAFLTGVSDSRVYKSIEVSLSELFDENEKQVKEYEEAKNEIENISHQKANLKNSVNQSIEVYKILESARDEQEKINLRLKLRTEIKKLVEWIKIYPLRQEEDELKDLKAKLQKAETLITEKKLKGEEISIGMKVHYDSLRQQIESIENKDDEMIQIFDSKYIDKVRIKFKGSEKLRLLSLVRTYNNIYI